MADKKSKTAGQKIKEYTDKVEVGFKDIFGFDKDKKDKKKKKSEPKPKGKDYETLSDMLSRRHR
jgi:hypothetical protein